MRKTIMAAAMAMLATTAAHASNDEVFQDAAIGFIVAKNYCDGIEISRSRMDDALRAAAVEMKVPDGNLEFVENYLEYRATVAQSILEKRNKLFMFCENVRSQLKGKP